ncbi:hypothetical protein [Streptomyces sp. MUM 203J]|nr:hypothetical protein [Streptomyces sp. MUM 203J]
MPALEEPLTKATGPATAEVLAERPGLRTVRGLSPLGGTAR